MSSSTQLRILTAVILMPAVAAAAWWSPAWLVAGLGAIVAVVALREFFALGDRLGFRAYRFWTCLAAIGIFAQQWYAAQAASIDTLGDLLPLLIVWVGDSAAYFAGHAFGRSKMTPHLSPNKTWEGAGANLLGALLVAFVFGYWMKIAPAHLFVMAALGSIAGQVGDLFESA